MATTLNSAANALLSNGLGTSPAATAALQAAANASPYFAGLLNAFAAKGGTFVVDPANSGTGANGLVVTIDSSILPVGSTGLYDQPLQGLIGARDFRAHSEVTYAYCATTRLQQRAS